MREGIDTSSRRPTCRVIRSRPLPPDPLSPAFPPLGPRPFAVTIPPFGRLSLELQCEAQTVNGCDVVQAGNCSFQDPAASLLKEATPMSLETTCPEGPARSTPASTVLLMP
ncbi:hypothetical protein chiPu_0005022 [Chiloscyllium punctatum]|uniref:Uncharacterized protein n=1 Tax=Chiloscyllium punctatum TaxID=137246 RepID=A0A401S879_CHIPU|nr:hypothetical protein [Chiloscyllium punctatum]